jgi:hypothetical protein
LVNIPISPGDFPDLRDESFLRPYAGHDGGSEADPIPGGITHVPVLAPWVLTDMESEEIESGRTIYSFQGMSNPGLTWLQLQAHAMQPLFSNLLGAKERVQVPMENHEIIGIPYDLWFPRGTALLSGPLLELLERLTYGFLQSVQGNIRQQGRYHASDNIAKHPITLEAVISRAQLRAPYGRGFAGSG